MSQGQYNGAAVMTKTEKIVDHFRTQIESGQLTTGDQLPTHRDMAWEWKCSVGTVTRAYRELERRGLTRGETGRGTYVFGTERDLSVAGKGIFFPPAPKEIATEKAIDLSMNCFRHPHMERYFQQGLAGLAAYNSYQRFNIYNDSRASPRDREIAVQWLKSQISSVSEDNVIITQGAQSGLYVTMTSLTQPGDIIATEEFGYPGIRAAADSLGLSVAALPMDEGGLIPDGFEAACRRGGIKLLVTVPTNHNPTGTTLSLSRRQRISEIAERYNVLIVEDAVYTHLDTTGIPSFRELSPAISIYITSLSKILSPALRLGYIVAPVTLIHRLNTQMTTINWMTSPMLLDLAGYFLSSNIVSKHAAILRKECRSRQLLGISRLAPWLSRVQIETPSPQSHLWVVPDNGMTASDLAVQAARENVLVVASDSFNMSKRAPLQAVRVCLMAVENQKILDQGLTTLARILGTNMVRSV